MIGLKLILAFTSIIRGGLGILMVRLMSETAETSGQISPRNSATSPVIVLTNADYKRPSSILNTRSRGSTPDPAEAYLPVYGWGAFMLSCHFFIGILLVLGSFFDFIWSSVDLVKPIIRPLKEIPTWMSFVLSFEVLISMLVSIKTPTMVLFGGSNRFSKYYRYKEHKVFLYASYGIIVGALACFGIHLSVYFSPNATKLTPYLPAGTFLLLHGLLNMRLYWELEDGGDSGNVMLLPYKPEMYEDEDGLEEMSEISSV